MSGSGCPRTSAPTGGPPNLHLRGAFQAYGSAGDPRRRLLLGPLPAVRRPFATYHVEALRWYDQWLKDLDTGVMDGDPIRIWVQGEQRWRGEREWPLARTRWTELFLGGPEGGLEGVLDTTPGHAAGRTYRYDPLGRSRLGGRAASARLPHAAARGGPRVTGPMVLTLGATISAADTDWLVWVCDEAADGTRDILTKGWLRGSHRALDAERSLPHRPWHPHTREAAREVEPGRPTEYLVEVLPTSNLFRAGHRLPLEVASCDPLPLPGRWANRGRLLASTNTVHEGRDHPSRLLVPVVPR